MGEVKNPGTYPLDKGRTLVAALAGAGGPTRDAKLRNTLIIRGDYHNNPEVIVSDASRMLRRGDISENVWLQAGDIIYVPSTAISDVNYFITQIVPILDVFLLGAFFGL
jgi:protein involved in polysaccharide export with SLBB domain